MDCQLYEIKAQMPPSMTKPQESKSSRQPQVLVTALESDASSETSPSLDRGSNNPSWFDNMPAHWRFGAFRSSTNYPSSISHTATEKNTMASVAEHREQD
ncbi:hypothetical protein MN608_05658 [Microdochium nivale]|nr:hypothetical protein MN608_05658 [Microdochium nivale]